MALDGLQCHTLDGPSVPDGPVKLDQTKFLMWTLRNQARDDILPAQVA